MDSQATFRQILEGKLSQNSNIKKEIHSENEFSPRGFAYLLGTIPPFQYSNPSRHQKYSQASTPFRNGDTRSYHTTHDHNAHTDSVDSIPLRAHAGSPPIQSNPRILNKDQQKAFAFINQWGTPLKDCFTSHELKKIFRVLAIKLHPDHGGSTLAFVHLKKSYEILKKVLEPDVAS